jgi:hypothetical protein
MTVTFLGTDPSSGVSGTKNSDNSTREYRATFRLRSTLPPSVGVFADVYTVLRTNGIYLGAFSAIDGGCWVKTINPKTAPGRNLASAGGFRRWDFLVDVTYSTNAVNKPEDQDDPTLRPPTINFSSTKWSSPATKSINGINPDGSLNLSRVENSAGDPITRERRRGSLVIKIGKTFHAFDPANVQEAPLGFLYSRNRYKWSPVPDAYLAALTGGLVVGGVQPGQGRIEDMTVTPTWTNGLIYVHVDAEFHVDPDGFADIVLDQGYTYKTPNGQKTRFMVPGGMATTPQNLDGNGHPLADNANAVIVNGGKGWQYYPPQDWSDLDLP